MVGYESIHYDESIPDLSKPFHINCKPDTDVWDKPPSTHSFNAPIIYRKTTVGAFQSAKVTVDGPWKHRYDQGGLALVVRSADGSPTWVKTGIEYLNEQTHVSVVATHPWSDWSLRPTLGGSHATIEITIHDHSLWLYLVDENGKQHPMREVTFWKTLDPNAELWVGVYAAKPAKEHENLVVQFRDLSIELA